MREHPILMSAESIRAILERRKTQSRRVIKSVLKEPLISKCPYGQVGDRLWVKEAFRICNSYDGTNYVIYKADDGAYAPKNGWRSSLFMPRSLSRLTLEITGLRVEKLQEITNADAVEEGIFWAKNNPRDDYMILWNSLNSKRGYGWNKNPWVWVISFKEVKDAK